MERLCGRREEEIKRKSDEEKDKAESCCCSICCFSMGLLILHSDPSFQARMVELKRTLAQLQLVCLHLFLLRVN